MRTAFDHSKQAKFTDPAAAAGWQPTNPAKDAKTEAAIRKSTAQIA